MIERLIRAILGQYPGVSRREYVNLVCDNAVLTSALEQKERARVRAVAEIRRLRRALNDTQRAIETQEAKVAKLETVYRVCHVNGQGFGYIAPMNWAAIPQPVRERAQVLALCPTQMAAQMIVEVLLQGRQDNMTYYSEQAGGTHWMIKGRWRVLYSSEVER